MRQHLRGGWALLVCAAALAASVSLAGCQTSECDSCGKSFSGAGYYDVLRGEDYTLCPDCAEDYYSPLPYEQYAK